MSYLFLSCTEIALKEINAGKLNKSEILTATPVVSTVMWDESQMYLKQGEQISVDQLLAGLVVMSANDAAVTLAERISGDIPNFVARMNQEAKADIIKYIELFYNHRRIQKGLGFKTPNQMAEDFYKLAA